jgi:hypothetical protein
VLANNVCGRSVTLVLWWVGWLGGSTTLLVEYLPAPCADEASGDSSPR